MTNTETDLKPCCAHKEVAEYRESKNGIVYRTYWACIQCRTEFAPIAATPDHGLDKVRYVLERCLHFKTNEGQKNLVKEALAILDGLSSPVVGNAVNDEAVVTLKAMIEKREDVGVENKTGWFAKELNALKAGLAALSTPISSEKDGNADGPLVCNTPYAREVLAQMIEQVRTEHAHNRCTIEGCGFLSQIADLAIRYATPPAAGWQIPDGWRTDDVLKFVRHIEILCQPTTKSPAQVVQKIWEFCQETKRVAPKPDETSK